MARYSLHGAVGPGSAWQRPVGPTTGPWARSSGIGDGPVSQPDQCAGERLRHRFEVADDVKWLRRGLRSDGRHGRRYDQVAGGGRIRSPDDLRCQPLAGTLDVRERDSGTVRNRSQRHQFGEMTAATGHRALSAGSSLFPAETEFVELLAAAVGAGQPATNTGATEGCSDAGNPGSPGGPQQRRWNNPRGPHVDRQIPVDRIVRRLIGWNIAPAERTRPLYSRLE